MSEPVANEQSEHEIDPNVSKLRTKSRLEHEISKNVSESMVSGHFEHKISKNVSGFGYGYMI